MKAVYAENVLALGLGLSEPWKILGQSFDMETKPYTLTIEIGAERGTLYPCPHCGELCKPHDFKEYSWRHLDFFQHHCYLKARVPRVNCPKHGIHRVAVSWSRPGSGFTLLFEQVVMSLAREMPVNAVARHVGVMDTRIWRIIKHYVLQAMNKLDLSNLCGIGLDETASKRGHNYVTVFIDMDRETRPVIFATPGKGKECLREFVRFLEEHGGNPKDVMEVVCDMSPAFQAAAAEEFPYAALTVDWFHVVQLFTHAVDDVRRAESHREHMPKGSRWTTLKGLETKRTETQEIALKELQERGLATSTAFRIKEMLRWFKEADTEQAAHWRATHFIKAAEELMVTNDLLKPMDKALNTFKEQLPRIIRRWKSLLTNARMEGFNGLFQAARARARGYRNVTNFITMIYLIGAPISALLENSFPQ
jgi:transposase